VSDQPPAGGFLFFGHHLTGLAGYWGNFHISKCRCMTIRGGTNCTDTCSVSIINNSQLWRNLMTNRREFIVQLSLGGTALMAGNAMAAVPMVVETDAQAVALGYKADATKADQVKFPKFAAGQSCSSCSLYQGKAGDAAGACPLFAGKQVSAKGWCSAYAKKA